MKKISLRKMTYKEIIAEVAKELNLSETFVNKVYRAYWKAVRNHITSLPLKEDLTDEEFSKLQPNVNIPSIGKLYVTSDRYRRVKKHHEIYQQLKNKNNAAHNGN